MLGRQVWRHQAMPIQEISVLTDQLIRVGQLGQRFTRP